MENITKALYMAIGVFIGIMILTAFVWVFRNGGEFLGTLNDTEINKKVEQYNADLIVYQRNNNTIYDVITACNLAYDINIQNDYDNVNYLEIVINNVGTLGNLGNNVNYDRGQSETNRLKSGCIYKLPNTSIKINDLIINPINGTDKLTTILEAGVVPGISVDERKYKYIFEGTVDYSQSGKINKIIFNCKENTPDPITGKYR